MTEVPVRPDSLRERKKARTRAAIRSQALALFREQGYTETTIEQIAAAADVSPATFFRYFPTKEDVVLQDDIDVISLAALDAQPPELSPLAAFRAAAAQSMKSLTPEQKATFRETTQLAMSVPEIRARAIDELARTTSQIAAALAARIGRSPDDFEVRNVAGAIIGVITAVTLPAHSSAAQLGSAVDIDDLIARIDRALEHLERGLPL